MHKTLSADNYSYYTLSLQRYRRFLARPVPCWHRRISAQKNSADLPLIAGSHPLGRGIQNNLFETMKRGGGKKKRKNTENTEEEIEKASTTLKNLNSQLRLFIVSNWRWGWKGEKLLELVETSVTNEDRVSMAGFKRNFFFLTLWKKEELSGQRWIEVIDKTFFLFFFLPLENEENLSYIGMNKNKKKSLGSRYIERSLLH